MRLARAAVHLSSEVHRGADRSWFSNRISAPFYTRSESRLVAKRVIRPANGNLAYLKELQAACEAAAAGRRPRASAPAEPLPDVLPPGV